MAVRIWSLRPSWAAGMTIGSSSSTINQANPTSDVVTTTMFESWQGSNNLSMQSLESKIKSLTPLLAVWSLGGGRAKRKEHPKSPTPNRPPLTSGSHLHIYLRYSSGFMTDEDTQSWLAGRLHWQLLEP